MENSLIYHYTSIETLHKILGSESKEICIRATHASFMNDPLEYDYANRFIEDSMILHEKNNKIKVKKSKYLSGKNGLHKTFAYIGGEPYILSFSKHKDDLSMWRAYGKDGNGVCIGFDTKMLSDYSNNELFKNTVLVECNYDKDEITNKMLKYWEKEYDNFIIEKTNSGGVRYGFDDFSLLFIIIQLGFTAKCSSYKIEKEWRLCTNTHDSINFKVNGNLLVPFIEHKLPKEIVKKIVIGPCLNGLQVEKGLSMFLKKYNFTLNKNFIERSEISYRQV